jgi:hypothetical protein
MSVVHLGKDAMEAKDTTANGAQTGTHRNDDIYAVTVEFGKSTTRKDDAEIVEEFPTAVQVENQDEPGWFSVTYNAVARDEGEARRAVVDLVRARIGVSAVGPIRILGTHVEVAA